MWGQKQNLCEAGLVDRLEFYTSGNSLESELKVSQLLNFQGKEDRKRFPILIYLKQESPAEYCQNWWYFSDSSFKCISHYQSIVSRRDQETIGGSGPNHDGEQPDQDISFLLSNTDLIEDALAMAKSANEFYTMSHSYSLLKHVVHQRKVQDEYAKKKHKHMSVKD